MSQIPPNDPVPSNEPEQPQAAAEAPKLTAPEAKAPVTTHKDSSVPDKADVDANKVFAIIAYLDILFLVPLIAAKDSPFAKYHANQGAVLYLATLAMAVPIAVIAMIPFVNCGLVCLIPILGGLRLVWTILGIINAANGTMKPLPLIGHFVLVK